MLLTFAAPQHRMDLLVIGVVASLVGMVWSPSRGPVLIGATLPTFFFTRTLPGPLSVTPPGLALMLSWLAILVRRRQLPLRFPTSAYDKPLALFLAAALLSLLVTQYPLLSVRDMRALILEPVLFFWLLQCLRGSANFALAGFLAGATLTALAAVVQGPLGIGGTPVKAFCACRHGIRRPTTWRSCSAAPGRFCSLARSPGVAGCGFQRQRSGWDCC